MLVLLGWAIWALLLLLLLSFWFGIVTSALRGQPFTRAILVQAALLTVVLIVFLIEPDWNKFHILWVAPIAFLFATVLNFSVPRRWREEP